MIKGIIFDLDGTLLDTIYDIQESLNKVLTKYKYNLRNYDEVRLALGKGSEKLIIDSLPKNTDREIIRKILKEYLEDYSKNYNNKTKPYIGIKETLKELTSKNIKLAVNSNKPDLLAKKLIKQHFTDINFVSVIGQKENIPTKPDPYTCNQIISTMNLDKNEILYVGDSESDIKTAENAKIKCIGCEWGFRDYQTLKQANYVIKQPKEILDIL